ncbi:MAG: phosphomannomutase/phosphoglucomutase [Armatimonadota bacterium]
MSMKQIDSSIFRAYDIRGTYPDQLNEDVVYHVVRAYAEKLKPKLAVVGRDMRLSSPSLTEQAIQALLDGGSDVIDVGLTTTPMYYYSVNVLNANAGVMVTASHNPKAYNGLKLTGPLATPSIDYISNDDLYKDASAADFETPSKPGRIIDRTSMIDRYTRDVLEASGINKFGGLKLVVDAGNGMDGIVLPELFKNADCEVIPLYWDPDGNFPNHEANPLKEETLDDLKQKVLETKANLGIAYDGDGDRVGFVDETGKHIPGDIVTAILAKTMLKEKPRAEIIYDVRSSWSVKEEIEKAGGKPVMWKVGHALIKKKMREIGAYFGGELSSHYYFQKFYITDNGDLAMLTMLKTILAEGKPLSEIAKPIMRYFHSEEINSKVADPAAKIAEVKECYQNGRIIELDGMTIEFDDWWFNLRPSQTEPVLRLNVEAKTKDLLESKVSEILGIVRAVPAKVSS